MTFRSDLEEGKKAEEYIADQLSYLGDYEVIDAGFVDNPTYGHDIGGSNTIEVKFDKMSKKTGNVAIELRCNGKASGLVTSTAEYWAFIFYDNGWYWCVVPTNKLCWLAKEKPTVKGGDNNKSEMVLIPISALKISAEIGPYKIINK